MPAGAPDRTRSPLWLALAAGGAASVFDAPTASVPGNAVAGTGPYRLGPPTKQHVEGIFPGGPAHLSQATYQVSPPNKADPAGHRTVKPEVNVALMLGQRPRPATLCGVTHG